LTLDLNCSHRLWSVKPNIRYSLLLLSATIHGIKPGVLVHMCQVVWQKVLTAVSMETEVFQGTASCQLVYSHHYLPMNMALYTSCIKLFHYYNCFGALNTANCNRLHHSGTLRIYTRSESEVKNIEKLESFHGPNINFISISLKL
jgi:hypothetical protein